MDRRRRAALAGSMAWVATSWRACTPQQSGRASPPRGRTCATAGVRHLAACLAALPARAYPLAGHVASRHLCGAACKLHHHRACRQTSQTTGVRCAALNNAAHSALYLLILSLCHFPLHGVTWRGGQRMPRRRAFLSRRNLILPIVPPAYARYALPRIHAYTARQPLSAHR